MSNHIPVYWVNAWTGEACHTDKGMEEIPTNISGFFTQDSAGQSRYTSIGCYGYHYTRVSGVRYWNAREWNPEWVDWQWILYYQYREWVYGAARPGDREPPVRMNQRDDGNGIGEGHSRLQSSWGSNASSTAATRIFGNNSYR